MPPPQQFNGIRTTMEASSFDRPIALVTGASSGIGQAYAELLASKGYDLWLVARREERLESLGQKLTLDHGVEFRATVCDLADRAQVRTLCDRISQEARLEVLVHNAGFGVNGEIGVADSVKLMAMVDVHVTSTIALCSAATPVLRARGKGAVVIVSSIAGWLTGAGSACYCATKSFETSFAISLGKELKSAGVSVQALCPGYTRTEFHDTPEYAQWNRDSVPKALWSTPRQVVECSWKRLGKDETCVPGRLNRVIVAVGRNGLVSSLRERFRASKKP
jgi:uncharacterized protein